MWDSAGQIQFKTIVQSFYKGADLIVFVYAVDDRESFEYCVTLHKEIVSEKKAKPQTKGIVIGNKADSERVVSYEEGKSFA